jgi:hypothetical protein
MALTVVGHVSLKTVARREAEAKVRISQNEICAFIRSIDAVARKQGKRCLPKAEALTLARTTLRAQKVAAAMLAKGFKS